MRNRVVYLDIIRILACVMIIAMHAPIPDTGLNHYVLSTISLITASGIGLFVMVSGALLLPVNLPTNLFLKRRFGKIIYPTLFWTFFYLIVYWHLYGSNLDRVWLSILSIPFSYQFGVVLWFVYMLAGLYLLAPILSPWLRQATKREIEFYLVLWAITMCYPYIRDYVTINEGPTGILYYFEGYVGYFLLGYYLNKYVNTKAVWKIFVLLLFPLFIATILKTQEVQVRFYDSFWYLSTLVAMMSIAWFLLVKHINVIYDGTSRLHSIIALTSNCCFGIYLVHIFIMRSIIWKWMWLHDMGIMQILLVTLMTFIGSLFVTWVISHLPGAEFIIGYRQKR